MNPEIVQIYYKKSIQKEGMLFVRTESILETMAKMPLIIASLFIVAIMLPTQISFGSFRTLELVIYSDGSTHISSQIDVNPLAPDFEVNLFGPSIDNFVAIGENGFLLSSEIIDATATIDTFGSSNITIDYDIHDLISKEGRVWTFSFDSPSNYTLLMPENSVIVGMSILPNNMEMVDEQVRLDISSGPAEINFIFSTPATSSTNQPVNPTDSSLDYTTAAIIGFPVISAIAAISLILKKRQSKSTSPAVDTKAIIEKPQEIKTVDTETIFKIRPEMRDDDKEIVKFISKNGGQVLESDLRKKFLQPRTTMWRAVKRLERLGIVEISKKDLQNMVKLKKELEKDE
ncbi:MAG: MarR family transcriptional regulator [Nitrosopumilus sp.]|nr:MarR family transcriptional regulator [Nitrosopumilus sp.]MDH3502093.1 MarR family transcriptional regulator [Nitrosopumilus sp.]